ncbi:hypothetical protein [Haloquadratum walsbyi]|jgi:hypothetical protein|uniref:Uncharacterized protein n=1 Tax=Haloquadratum walsbyi J07HQW2 TaxID=1238425 RepID=U1NCW1_9EURY|nr:hypothetical protein [Haloquadratum walsbyi]ERG94528.1 MAG: hypothetical protein J07HQW2_00963 [Haloquadratum walsbyi J07HQW2]
MKQNIPQQRQRSAEDEREFYLPGIAVSAAIDRLESTIGSRLGARQPIRLPVSRERLTQTIEQHRAD